MTKLLVSVRDAVEADAALEGNADVIDVKEPVQGPLGRAAADEWQRVDATIAGRVPLSAALGELLSPPAREMLARLGGYAFAKMGLAGCADQRDWLEQWRNVQRQLPSGTELVAAAYADFRAARAPDPFSILDAVRSTGCSTYLIDTFDKSQGSLLDCLSTEALARLRKETLEAGMSLVVAGSLRPDDLPRVTELRPEMIAVRGAVCRGGRLGPLDGELVQSLARRLSTGLAEGAASSSGNLVDSARSQS